eukprot:scaffold11355_cov59-Phaeocystis_antarctica.AAC.8
MPRDERHRKVRRRATRFYLPATRFFPPCLQSLSPLQTKLSLQQPVGSTLTSTVTSMSAQMSNADEDTLRATSTDAADESGEIQEMRKELMEMDLAHLKTMMANIKEQQPDVELPSGGKEEIVAWAIEWCKARVKADKEEVEEEKRVEEEERRAEEERVAHAREEARLLFVEPDKDTPDQLHAFLLANPLTVPAFVNSILTDGEHADWLGEAVKATPELAELTDADGRRAFAFAHLRCKQACET